MNSKSKGKLTIVYSRSATKEPATKERLLEDEQRCIALAKENGVKNLKIIRDFGASGMTLKRKGMTKLLRLVREKKVSAIYVKHPDRLSRSTLDYIQMRKLFEKKGVALRTLDGVMERLASMLCADMSRSVRQLTK